MVIEMDEISINQTK